jgi:hypothetical protein
MRRLFPLTISAVLLSGGADGALRADQPPSVADEAKFYRLIFGKNTLNTEVDADFARGRLDSTLRSWIIYIDQLCGLTEEQETKLRLAGQGDIRRFLDRVEEVKHAHRETLTIPGEIRSLQEAWTLNPFLDGSLFWKTLKKNLSGAQVAKLESALKELELRDQRELIWAFVELESKALSLSATQQARFAELLIKETRPSHRLFPYRYKGLWTEVTGIPESKLKPIFNESQWHDLRRELAWMKTTPPNIRNEEFYFRSQRANRQAAKRGQGK